MRARVEIRRLKWKTHSERMRVERSGTLWNITRSYEEERKM